MQFCSNVVNAKWFWMHTSLKHRPLPLLVNTELSGKHWSLFLRMRSKLVVLLLSHFSRLKTDEMLQTTINWARRWWIFNSLYQFLIQWYRFHISTMHLLFFPFFLTKEKSNIFPFMEYAFLVCKEKVGAGIDNLISISDRIGPSVSCGKMERTRPARKERNGKVLYFPPEPVILLWCCHFEEYFSLFVPSLSMQKIIFSQEKVYLGKMKVLIKLFIIVNWDGLLLFWVLTIIPSKVDFRIYIQNF